LADVKAIYSSDLDYGYPLEVADNGDLRARMENGDELLVRGGAAQIVHERLTGPIVTRAEDLLSVWREQAQRPANENGTIRQVSIVSGETRTVNGRRGTAYFIRYEDGAFSEEPVLVMGDDPALRALGPAMARLVRMEMERHAASIEAYQRQEALEEALMVPIIGRGVPLQVGSRKLVWVEQAPIPPERFAIPAEPETIAAVRTRLAAEAKAQETGFEPPRDRAGVKTALFAEERLWLLTDSGLLSSLAEGDPARRIERPGGYPLDMCAGPAGPILLTANGKKGRAWTIRRRRAGGWEEGGTVVRKGDEALVALACDAGRALVLTTRRIVTLAPARREVALSGERLWPALVRPAVHVRDDQLFLGLNAGEWGGGLRRIDLRTGALVTLERNAGGDLCGGPLNTKCDPVQGIATIPWKPDCVMAAIGLVHMLPHGRIVEICGDRIEQLYARNASNIPLEALQPDRRDSEMNSIAFFGLVRFRDTVLAAGHDGLYRFSGPGEPSFQPFPRFREVDGILVSFALPDAVLLVTTINRRASVSGGAPMIVPR
jgi:hypothetical protein